MSKASSGADRRTGSAGTGPNGRADTIELFIADALRHRDEGNDRWLEDACESRPEWMDDVRRGVQELDGLPGALMRGSDTDPRLGSLVADRYELTARVGSGAMGVVYRATDRDLEREVAIKFLLHGLMDAEQAKSRFAREAEAMAASRHGSVISVYDRGEGADGEAYIVMEFIDGVPLGEVLSVAVPDEILQRDDVDWVSSRLGVDTCGAEGFLRLAVRWAAELAAGLSALHSAGVLHRDVKPSNILVRRDGTPVLLDFGIAALEGSDALTRTGAGFGTPAYMAPEALGGGAPVSPATDIYGLTATLQNMLTLRPLFDGPPGEILAAIATRDPVPACQLRTGVPRDLQAILDKGLARSPEARYSSAEALASDLRSFLAHRPVVARRISPLRRTARRMVRSRAVRGAAVALVLVALSLGVVGARERKAAHTRGRHVTARQHLPPNFAIVGPANRVYRFEEDRAALEALLDELVATATSALPSQLLRASFRLDHGDSPGAAEDMASVAAEVGGDYASKLADMYRAVGDEPADAFAVDLAPLPDPERPVELYLHAFHLMRHDQWAEPRRILALPEVRAIDHAEEMRLVTLPFGRVLRSGDVARANVAYFEALELERRMGGRTATTAHVIGRFLDIGGRFREAAAVLDEGIALADRSHTIRINAGVAALGLGDFEAARSHYGIAVELRPNYSKPALGMIWTCIAEGSFDEAMERVQQAPLGKPRPWVPSREAMASAVLTSKAVAMRASADGADWQSVAAEAFALRQAAIAEGFEGTGPETRLLDALLQDSDELLALGRLKGMHQEPFNWRRIADVVEHLPAELGVEETAIVKDVLKLHGEQFANSGASAAGDPSEALSTLPR